MVSLISNICETKQCECEIGEYNYYGIVECCLFVNDLTIEPQYIIAIPSSCSYMNLNTVFFYGGGFSCFKILDPIDPTNTNLPIIQQYDYCPYVHSMFWTLHGEGSGVCNCSYTFYRFRKCCNLLIVVVCVNNNTLLESLSQTEFYRVKEPILMVNVTTSQVYKETYWAEMFRPLK